MGLPHCGHLVQRPSVRTSWSEGGTISWASRLNQVIEWLLGRLGRPICDSSGKWNARAANDLGGAGAKCCRVRVETRSQLPLNPWIEARDAEAAIRVVGRHVHVPYGGWVGGVRGDLEDVRAGGNAAEVVFVVAVIQRLRVAA